jgi:hypothetical protein
MVSKLYQNKIAKIHLIIVKVKSFRRLTHLMVQDYLYTFSLVPYTTNNNLKIYFSILKEVSEKYVWLLNSLFTAFNVIDKS